MIKSHAEFQPLAAITTQTVEPYIKMYGPDRFEIPRELFNINCTYFREDNNSFYLNGFKQVDFNLFIAPVLKLLFRKPEDRLTYIKDTFTRNNVKEFGILCDAYNVLLKLGYFYIEDVKEVIYKWFLTLTLKEREHYYADDDRYRAIVEIVFIKSFEL